MARIKPAKADELRRDLRKATRYNDDLRKSAKSEECPGCFGAGTGGRCCICGGTR